MSLWRKFAGQFSLWARDQPRGIEITARGRGTRQAHCLMGGPHSQGPKRSCRNPACGKAEDLRFPLSSLLSRVMFRVPVKSEVLHSQHERWCCQSAGFLEGLSRLCRRGVPRLRSRDSEHAELARLSDHSFSCLLPPSWQRPRNVHRYKTDFVFEMFWIPDPKGCIKTFL